jgi:aryl-alcohol dehydrogenase-like predicted oxidoreductase
MAETLRPAAADPANSNPRLDATMELRRLGNTEIKVSPVALGCWPIAGMTSLGVNDADSLATIRACFDLGINHLDTAFCYGLEGQSERLIARALAGRRDEMVIATKGGLSWDENREPVHDASPGTLRRQCEESLRRLETDRVELYYVHAPDENVPVAETAGAMKALMDEGKARSVGVSSFTLAQLEAFAAECPLSAYQPPYNMLQRGIEVDTLPWCRRKNVAVMVYWPLLKGLLAGKIARDHVFAKSDVRNKYPMFRGREWQKNHDLLDKLRNIADAAGRSVAELVVNWTIHQPGVTAALCGAKRPDQIRETAAAAIWKLTDDQLAEIDRALAERGTPITKSPV